MSTRLFALLLSKPATFSPATVLTKSCRAAISSSSQETYVPLLVRCFSSPPEKTQKGTFSKDDVEMMEMYKKLMVKYKRVYNTQEEKKGRFNLFKETIEENIRHFSYTPDNAKCNIKDSVDVETMRKMFEEWMAKDRRFYDREEEKERRFNLFKETVEENVRRFSSLAKSNEDDSSVEEDVEMKKMFEEWMAKLERRYSSPQEKENRFKIFKENVRKINAHNKEGDNFIKTASYTIEAVCAKSFEETTNNKLQEIEAQILRKRNELRQFESEPLYTESNSNHDVFYPSRVSGRYLQTGRC